MITASLLPDQFFGADQMWRLDEPIVVWRQARDICLLLPSNEQDGLDALIDTELNTADRCAAWIADELEHSQLNHAT